LRNHDNSIVVYPKVGLWGDGSHHGLVFRFLDIDRSGKGPSEDIRTLFRAVREEAEKSNRDIVISSEALRTGTDVRAFVEALRPHVGGESTAVELLVVYREHFARAASWYNHRIRAIGETRTPDEFLNDLAANLCYASLLKGLDELGFKISVLNYQPSESTVARFLTHIGFPPSSIPKVNAKRVSLSPKGLVTKLAINNLVPDKQLNRECYLKFRKLPDSHSASQFIFGHEAAASAEEVVYRQDREYLHKRFGIEPETPLRDEQASALYVLPEEFEQIAGVAKEMGELGERILQYVAGYVHDQGRQNSRSA
jgi:hypothetical protein